MYNDTKEELKNCESCQIHAPIQRQPKHDLIPVTSAWPFFKWGIDIVGPFPEAPGRFKFLLVAADYFTKWVEAKPLTTITGQNVVNFVWENVVCRFGIPKVIVSDNGKQFAEGRFKEWCEGLKIQQAFTSVYHPQANGQVEVTNRDIVRGIKSRLGRKKGGWVDELPNVLWALRTTPKRSTGETPFSLAYGSEALLPAEINVPSYRYLHAEESMNKADQRENLDLLEERRNLVAFRQAKYKKELERYYNKKVRKVSFKVGEFVMRNNEVSKAAPGGKLGQNWEGPYQIAETYLNGSYKLKDLQGKTVDRTWHATNLKRCYL